MSIIKVEKLSKKYILSHQQRESYTTLRDVISEKVKAVGRMVLHPLTVHHSPLTNSSQEEFWALKDVSFEINQGDRVGIIGRNGAGKSTLLKILSRITEPTSGKIGINGRVASLLEVGTGFHPELTGRENIFLNGAILGMGRVEIKRKFDEIVTFAEVERFLDTSVKHYSSGMYVRLAFAVAAHLEPDILIVDEVLAVGDALFQKKCLGKMEDVGRDGTTVLFVSHNMASIRALCEKGFLLDGGEIAFNGNISEAIETYLSKIRFCPDCIPVALRERGSRYSLRARIVDIEIESRDEPLNLDTVDSTQSFSVILTIESYSDTKSGIYLAIRDQIQVLNWFDSGHLHREIFSLKKGLSKIECNINPTYLTSGSYSMDCGLTIPNQEWIDFVPSALSFTVNGLDPYGSGFDLSQTFARYHVHHEWKRI